MSECLQGARPRSFLNPSRLSSCTVKQEAGEPGGGSLANGDTPHLGVNVPAHVPLTLKSSDVNSSIFRTYLFTLPFPLRAVSQVSGCPAL